MARPVEFMASGSSSQVRHSSAAGPSLGIQFGAAKAPSLPKNGQIFHGSEKNTTGLRRRKLEGLMGESWDFFSGHGIDSVPAINCAMFKRNIMYYEW